MFWGNRKPLHAQRLHRGANMHAESNGTFVFWFFHPDYTVGTGIAPVQPKRLADFHRRWRIALRPETDINVFSISL